MPVEEEVYRGYGGVCRPHGCTCELPGGMWGGPYLREVDCPVHGGWDHVELRARERRYREVLEQIADAEKAESADAGEWAVWAHDLAREALATNQEEADR